MCLSGETAHVDEKHIPAEVGLEALVIVELTKVSLDSIAIAVS